MSDTFLDYINRRQLTIDQFANYLIKQYATISLDDAYKAARLILLDAEDITTPAQLNRVIKALSDEIPSVYNLTQITDELNNFGVAENVWMTNTIATFADVVMKQSAKNKVKSYIEKSLMSLESGTSSITGTWSEFVKSNEDKTLDTIINQVKTGYAKSETTQQIIKRVKIATDGVSKNSIESLVRTGVHHYAQQARLYMRDDNKEVFDGGREMPIVTFDSRTSPICISISAKYQDGWPVGGSPIGYPPFHYNAVCSGEMVTTLFGEKPIEDVNVGDYVLTHKGRFKKVLTLMSKRNETDFVRVIRLKSGSVIRVTDEHPLLLDVRGWDRADKVKVGDYLFEHVKQDFKSSVGVSVFKRNSYDYPSLFDGEEVFFKVGVCSASVTSSVNFDHDLPAVNGKISNAPAKLKLMRIATKSASGKRLNKLRLSESNCTSMPFGLCVNKGFISRLCGKRVMLRHSLGMRGMNIASFFGHSISPMIFPNTKPFGNSYIASYLGALGFTHRFDAMNSTPSTHRAIGKRKLTLNGSKCESIGKMMLIDEIGKKGFISKFKHSISPSVVESISIVEHKGMVYNLEIEDDQSYVVGGIVAHNCRTSITFLPEGVELEGTRPSIQGKDGQEAEEAFERKTVKKYTGRKDEAFESKQIPVNTPYSKFLAEQPRWFVDKVLGKTKAEAFLSGELDLSNLTFKDLRPKSLADLNLE